ncbi:helix-turn-helix domain-containing protein [Gordonia paraffinivorans]|uniref:helix-turn-helix domain-containing protein n=1 Tax=Gordonia paraffinivorans TaxID=175628 RepID=UPI00144871E8|nr:helix-turn-helix transcriptional regulator [Gordonia paraffinivorans]
MGDAVKTYDAAMPQPDEDRSFGQIMRSYRERAGLSQRALAERLQELGVAIDQTAIARMESGKREPKLSEAAQISWFLNFDLHEAAVDVGQQKKLFLMGSIAQVEGSYVKARQAINDYLEAVEDAVRHYRPIGELEDTPGLRNKTEFAQHLLDAVTAGPKSKTLMGSRNWPWLTMPYKFVKKYVDALTFDLQEELDGPET